MILSYTTNPGINYIASKMDDSAITKIKSEVSSSVTKTYTKTIFQQIETLSVGLKNGAKGSTLLKDGVNQLVSGNQSISQNLKVLALSTLTFEDGAKTLTNRLKDYTEGVIAVDKGFNTLKIGLDQMHQSIDPLLQGVNQLNSGASSLYTGISQYTTGVSQAYLGIQQLDEHTDSLLEGSKILSSATQTLAILNTELTAKLKDYSLHLGSSDTIASNQDMKAIIALQQTISVVTTNLNSSVNGGTYYVLKDGNVVLDANQQPITTTITKEKTASLWLGYLYKWCSTSSSWFKTIE